MEDLFLGVLAVIDFHNKIQVVYSMINTARSEPLKRVGTLFLIWLLVAT